MELLCTVLILSTEYQRDWIYTGSLSGKFAQWRELGCLAVLTSFKISITQVGINGFLVNRACAVWPSLNLNLMCSLHITEIILKCGLHMHANLI